MKKINSQFAIRNTQFFRGYIATSTILVVMVVVLALTATASLLSIGEGQSSLSLLKGEETYQFMDGCAEDALIKSWNDVNYTGGNITRPEGTCTVSVSKSGSDWTLNISTTNTDYKKNLEVKINRGATGITLTSWKEI